MLVKVTKNSDMRLTTGRVQHYVLRRQNMETFYAKSLSRELGDSSSQLGSIDDKGNPPNKLANSSSTTSIHVSL